MKSGQIPGEGRMQITDKIQNLADKKILRKEKTDTDGHRRTQTVVSYFWKAIVNKTGGLTLTPSELYSLLYSSLLIHAI